ncbi:MAG: pyridoxal-phosphate dependent enzyme [Thermoanaerobaculia bacterium]|nr:pyridoxal-phosphate dependent enzyme [Thermoanaerobaculia bacterium]
MVSATSVSIDLPRPEDVREAASRLSGRIHRTPLLANRSIVERGGIETRLKCENLQRTGSFKIRGALNALLRLPDELRDAGVVAFSSGNHAQAVALAAKITGIRATIVMPEESVAAKMAATRGYGAEIVSKGVDASNRRAIALGIAESRGATVIPPFDHPDIIAGAGTAILEALEDRPEARSIVVPLGGGGLLAGTALAATSVSPGISVWGVEPEDGDDVRRSFEAGEIVEIEPPDTIADGARTTAVGERNFEIIRKRVSGIATVSDDEILETLSFAISRTKLMIEPTGALALAAVLENRIPELVPPTIVLVSGGNVDFRLFRKLT